LDNASKAAALFGVTGFLMYVVVRQGYEGYYGILLTSPDEAGVTEPFILTHAALAIGLVAFVLTLALPLGLLAWAILTELVSGARDHLPTVLAVWFTSVLLVVIDTLILRYQMAYQRDTLLRKNFPDIASPELLSVPLTTILPIAIALIGISSVASLLSLRRPTSWSKWVGNSGPNGCALLCVAIVLLALGAFANAYGRAQAISTVAKSHPLGSTVTSIFSFNDRNVCVAWMNSVPIPKGFYPTAGDHYEYLGASAGETILYQYGIDLGPVRVPSGSIVLTPDHTPCPSGSG
jgi:hypothetical protein